MNAPTKLPPNSHQVPTHRNVHVALCAAQSEMGTVVKGSVNPAFKSRYADLSDVMTVVVPALTAHGICVYHTMIRDEGQLMMRTVFAHGETDTSLECDVPLIVNKNDMQGMKSATTYAKRVGVESLSGVAPSDDDDGNAAAKAAPMVEDRPRAPTDKAIGEAINYLTEAADLNDLKGRWDNLPTAIRAMKPVEATKDTRKAALEAAPPANADLADEIPY